MTISERHTKARQDFAKFIKDFPMTLEDLDGEEWREIEGLDDYLVSTCGRVKALRRKHRVHERILKPQLHAKFDYLFVWLKRNGQERRYLIHRLVAETFVLNPLNKPYVNHINGVKFCNEVSNLEWVTHSENIHHAFSTGLEKSGEEHPKSKLTNEQVEWCRAVYKPRDKEFGAEALAKKLGVVVSTMRMVLCGKTYKNVGGQIHKAQPALTDEQKEYVRNVFIRGDKVFGRRALAKRFGVNLATIDAALYDETAANCHTKCPMKFLTAEEKAAIRTEYKKGVKGHGVRVLAKKFGVNSKTILKVVKEK